MPGVLLRIVMLFALAGPALAAEPFQIAVIGAGEQVAEAAKAAVKTLPKEKFKDLDIRVGWVKANSAPEAEQAVRGAMEVDHAAVIIGGESPGAQRAILRALRGKRAPPFISIADYPPEQEERNPYLFRVGPNRGHLLVALEDALKKMEVSRLLLLEHPSASAANSTVRKAFPSLRTEPLTPATKPDGAALFVPWTSVEWLKEQKEILAALQGTPLLVEGHAAHVLYKLAPRVISLTTAADGDGPQLKNAFAARAYAATQLVLAALEDSAYRQKRDPASFARTLRANPVQTVLGRMDFSGGGECAALTVAAVTVPEGPEISRTKGAACRCIDEACCRNCCVAKSKSCNQGSCE